MLNKKTDTDQNTLENYQEIKLADVNDQLLLTLNKLAIELSHAHVDANNELQLVITGTDLKKLDANGIHYETIHADLEAFYASRLNSEYESRDFQLGSMGGYYTFSEIEEQLDALFQLYPEIISEKISIGQSLEGRDIWMVRMSDNPMDDEDEAEVLYTGLHHAREPMSYMNQFYFMNWLGENYESDPFAANLINNRELYFIPAVNPDGLVYNQSIASNGGGMQRKNMRETCDDGVDGVDLNRNYSHMWGIDDSGSSPDGCSETYRGLTFFSEPETTAIKDFVEEHDFKIALNYHSYSNLLIYPFGYADDNSVPLEDLDIFIEYGQEMVQYNGYALGTGPELLYPVNGEANDWMYGEHSVFAYTPEIGSSLDGFWPPTARIIPLAEENLFPNQFVAEAAGPMFVTNLIIPDNTQFIPNNEYTVDITIFNAGLSDTLNVTAVTINSRDDFIDLDPMSEEIDSTVTLYISHLESRELLNISQNIKLSAAAPDSSDSLALDIFIAENCTTTVDCRGQCGGIAQQDDCGTCDMNQENDCYIPLSCAGDINNDNAVDVIDIIELINIIFDGSTVDGSDVNHDGQVNVQDIIQTVNIILNETSDCDSGACAENFTMGCNNTDYCYSSSLLGNSTCEEALNCLATGWDNGDCPYCGDQICSASEDCLEDCPPCDAGYIGDCADDDCCLETWIGDGYCDGASQTWGCDLTCYNNDEGDCPYLETEYNSNADDFPI